MIRTQLVICIYALMDDIRRFAVQHALILWVSITVDGVNFAENRASHISNLSCYLWSFIACEYKLRVKGSFVGVFSFSFYAYHVRAGQHFKCLAGGKFPITAIRHNNQPIAW